MMFECGGPDDHIDRDEGLKRFQMLYFKYHCAAI